MNSELKHRMYDYEVTPPVTAWDKIAAALDESHLTDQFPRKLYAAVVTPPPAAWDAVSASLDELYPGNRFPSTLYNLEAAPPVSAWDKIASALDSGEKKTPRPRIAVMPWMRYAAAAVILAAIAFGSVRILGKQEEAGQEVATGNGTSLPIKEGLPGNPLKETPSNTATPADQQSLAAEEARNDAALEQSKHTYASLDRGDKKRMKKVSEEFFQLPADPIEVAANFNPVHTYEELACTDVNTPVFAGSSTIDIAGRYAMLLTPEGHYIRISKKLGDLVCCVSGEQQDDECLDQLKKWRKKIANSPVAPSPGNFMDIVDLVNALKDSNL